MQIFSKENIRITFFLEFVALYARIKGATSTKILPPASVKYSCIRDALFPFICAFTLTNCTIYVVYSSIFFAKKPLFFLQNSKIFRIFAEKLVRDKCAVSLLLAGG